MKIKKRWFEYIGFVLPLLLALICLLSVTLNNHQAMLAVPMPQEFTVIAVFADELLGHGYLEDCIITSFVTKHHSKFHYFV